MRCLRYLSAFSLFLLFSLIPVSIANAGQLSVAGASISWDDGTFYVPQMCTNYNFNYTTTDQVNIATITISNKFNDKIGNNYLFSNKSGTIQIQVCDNNNFLETKVELNVAGYDLSNQVVSLPINFLPRTKTPTPSATPKPTPSTSITPVQRDVAEIEKLNALNASLFSQINSLNTSILKYKKKLQKICSVKPKPRFC